MKRILLLGATGSIGLQTVDVIEQHPDQFCLVGIAAGHQVDVMQKIIDKHPTIQVAGISDVSKAKELSGVTVYSGNEAMVQCIENCEYDLLVNAVVGFRGLKPTLTSLKKGIDVALANKESLVAGGVLVRQTLQETNTKLYPIDSEHSAIFQSLQGNRSEDVKRLIITASGGSFRDKTRDELSDVTVEQTLKHPNWSMGAKITIDSATMMNKGFEVIEARWLFNTPCDRINVVVHPESIIHSMIEYEDGSVIAQLACPDMREPIQFAIGFPERLPLANKKLDFAELGGITFFKPDTEKFPALALAYKAMERGGNIPCALNAANEAAVAAYLHDRISFYWITDIVGECIECTPFIKEPSVEDIFKTNEEIYSLAQRKIEGIAKKG